MTWIVRMASRRSRSASVMAQQPWPGMPAANGTPSFTRCSTRICAPVRRRVAVSVISGMIAPRRGGPPVGPLMARRWPAAGLRGTLSSMHPDRRVRRKGRVETMTQVAEPGSGVAAAGRDEKVGPIGAVHHWIGGRIVEGASGRRGPVYDPATGRLAREVDFATADEVGAAVAAAKAAFPGWRATSLSKRTEILFRIRNLVETHRKDIAAHLSAEHGKVPSDALGEIARGLENLEFACGIPSLLKGGFTEQASTGVDVFQIRQPLGVVAGITPFNFPAMVPMWMFGNAIACGNTF